jgi:hypothetical protein
MIYITNKIFQIFTLISDRVLGKSRSVNVLLKVDHYFQSQIHTDYIIYIYISRPIKTNPLITYKILSITLTPKSIVLS